MAVPFRKSDLHVNALLTNVAMAYSQEDNGFVYDKVFPRVTVSKSSDFYKVFNQGDFLRGDLPLRARSTEARKVIWGASQDQYQAYLRSLRHDIDDQDRGDADPIMQLERNGARLLTGRAKLYREKTFVETYLKPGVWGTQRQGVAAAPSGVQVIKWSDGLSTPIEDVRRAKRAQKLKSGYRPNIGTMSSDVWDELVDHPDILSRIAPGGSASNPAIVTRQVVAALFELDAIYVEDAIENVAQEGQVDDFQFVATGVFLLSYAPKTPSTDTPSAGYTFAWNGMPGMNEEGIRVREYRMENLSSDVFEIDLAQDMKLTGANLGTLFYDLI